MSVCHHLKCVQTAPTKSESLTDCVQNIRPSTRSSRKVLKTAKEVEKNGPDKKMPGGCSGESGKDKISSRPAGFKGKGTSRMKRGVSKGTVWGAT